MNNDTKCNAENKRVCDLLDEPLTESEIKLIFLMLDYSISFESAETQNKMNDLICKLRMLLTPI